MKKFKITIVSELELPDDFEVAVDPKDQVLSLKQGHDYYYPTIEWLGRKYRLDGALFGEHETAPGVQWQSLDDDTSNDFINAREREDYEIEQIDNAT